MSKQNEILYKLVFSRKFRHVISRYVEIGKPINDFFPEDMSSRFLDMKEIEKYATLTRTLVDDNTLSGKKHLSSSFGKTIKYLLRYGKNIDDLFSEFMESPFFLRYVQLEPYKTGICIEEAFFCYAKEKLKTYASKPKAWIILSHEFYRAMMMALTVSSHPVFSIETISVSKCGDGFCHLTKMSKSIWNYLNNVDNTESEKPKVNLNQHNEINVLYFGGPRFISGQIGETTRDILETSIAIAHYPSPERQRILGNLFQKTKELSKLMDLGII